MRWILMLCLLAGCAASPEAAKWESAPDWLFDADAVTYERPANASLQAKDGWVVADLTLVDLDAGAAKRLLGIEEPRDIAPRAVSKPAGEIAMLLAERHDAGEVIARKSMLLEMGESTPIELLRDSVYLSDVDVASTSSERLTWILSNQVVGTSGEMKVAHALNGHMSIQTDLHSTQLGLQTFHTSMGPGRPVDIDVPQPAHVHRVAVESVLPGQTAVFQLSRIDIKDQSRILLLLVRIADE